jgi:hypothetical protein
LQPKEKSLCQERFLLVKARLEHREYDDGQYDVCRSGNEEDDRCQTDAGVGGWG